MILKKEVIKVVFFQRRPQPIHKSIEIIFDDVRKRMPEFVDCLTVVFRYYSQGLFKRLYTVWEAYKNQADVNHITGDIHFCALLLEKHKTMMTIHDCRMLSDTHGLKQFVFKTFWYTLPLRRCALLTVVSQSTKQQLLSYVRYPAEKIIVIPDAVPTAFVYHFKQFNSLKPVILQVGTTVNKNLDRLIEAIGGISCHLNIIGQLSAEIVQKLFIHNIEYSNSFNLSEPDLVQQYIQCDIVSFVSTYEGFGMPILEANSVGRPVISSNILSMPEVAGNAACLVNPLDVSEIKNGILQIINNDVYRETLVRNGIENSRRFDAQKIAESYLECYKELSGKFFKE